MQDQRFSIVTGAYGYTGKYIARQLLARGERVATLTGHPDRPNEFGDTVRALPMRFDDPKALAFSMKGAQTLYNTYWVRFDRGVQTYARAIRNTGILLSAAKHAGIRRIVHIGITNPSLESPLPYFHGKALLEEGIKQSGLSYAILRPSVIFGQEDILINNIAFFLRRSPLFAIPGSGSYRLQPIFVEDMAQLAVEHGAREENVVMDATGPDVLSFQELVSLIAVLVKSKAKIIHVPEQAALALTRILSAFVGDVVLTAEELEGLRTELLVSHAEPTAKTSLRAWLQENASSIGTRYASELARHYRT